jgi:hypothetical protein
VRPCVGEIPDLQKINEEYADKGFSIIGVLIGDDDYDGARQFMSDTASLTRSCFRKACSIH